MNTTTNTALIQRSNRKHFRSLLERKNYYIEEFFEQLCKSDPKNSYFNKKDLIEIHSYLRKEAISTPWLYKLLETIVNDGVFLDDGLIEFIENQCSYNENNNHDNCTENQIIQLQQICDEQIEIKKLIEFNQNRIEKCMNSNENNNSVCNGENSENKIILDNLKQSLDKIYEQAAGTTEDNGALDDLIGESLKNFHEIKIKYNETIDLIQEKFLNELHNEMNIIMIDYLKMKSLSTTASTDDLIEFTDKNLSAIKSLCNGIINQFFKLKILIENYEKNLQQYQNHCQMRMELNILKWPIEKQLNTIRYTYSNNKSSALNNNHISTEEIIDSYDELYSKLLKNFNLKMTYDKIVNIIKNYDVERMMIEYEIEMFENNKRYMK